MQIPSTTSSTFPMFRIARGQALQVRLGTRNILQATHWDGQRSRPCLTDLTGEECELCQSPRTRAKKWSVFTSAQARHDDPPKLLILPTTAISWAADTSELLNQPIEIRRAKRTNQLRTVPITTDADKSWSWDAAAAPLEAWLGTLWQMNLHLDR